MGTKVYTLFKTSQIVVSRYEDAKIVGFEKENNKPDGWRFDIKRWSSLFDMRLPTLPNLSDFNLQGIKASEFYQSGVLDTNTEELKITSLQPKTINYESKWLPNLISGDYYRFNTKFHYYSNKSHVQYINTSDNIDNKNVLPLNFEPNLIYPITAAIYKRDQDGVANYYKKIEQVYFFSGTYTNGIENRTIINNIINWNNVNINKKEFIVDSSRQDQTILWFNKDYTKTFGIEPVNYSDLDLCKPLGSSNGSNYQVFYLQHFPVIPESFKLYIADETSWQEWERADTWFDLINSPSVYNTPRYFLDRDLGIIYFGDGINRPKLGSYIYAKYTVTPRVEYEKESTKNFNIFPFDANTNVLSQYINQGFVCITHNQLYPSEITLSINKDLIPFSYDPKVYGPILASEYAILKATVKTADGIPIPGIEVKFDFSPNNLGYLDGAISSYSVTNGQGEAYTSFQSPTSTNNLGYYVTNETTSSPKVRPSTHASYTAHNEIIIPDKTAALAGSEEYIYIYQILKDDLLYGYDNVSDYIDANFTPPGWTSDSDPATQAANILQWKEEIKLKYGIKDWFEVNGPTGIKPNGTISGRKVILYKSVAATYQTTEPKGIIDNGTDNYDSLAIHPITGDAGAIVPIKPVFVDKINNSSDPYNGYTRLIYEEDALILPEPTNSNNNIAGYWVVSRKNVKFTANCLNTRYNNYIYSNEIYASLTIPNYMLGEYISSKLGTIPYGWKLTEENNNYAASLNGVTFLTVNPQHGPYEILDLINGTSTGTWASAPSRTLSFLVTI